jgi:hypothetical protein
MRSSVQVRSPPHTHTHREIHLDLGGHICPSGLLKEPSHLADTGLTGCVRSHGGGGGGGGGEGLRLRSAGGAG